ncbi:type II toxin-antitoxin system HicB family antitoxin [Candidatus Peregrinibacteria bacterium]|nr:type II toxin-antitoxin system HicB family antitoxin [Candidatus Peregrinibacteria bacterium]
MKKYNFNIVVTQDEDAMYIADVPDLPGCHTQAKTLVQLYRRVNEAIALYLEVEKAKKQPVIQHKFVTVKQVEVII